MPSDLLTDPPPATRSFAAAYTAGEARARQFLVDDFSVAERRIDHTRQAARPIHPDVARAIERTMGPLLQNPACAASLHTLISGAAVVVTGQQVGLFGGPLYSYYKAASAVVTARALAAESGVTCVPLFWLQTEDHDFAEIASATVPVAESGALCTLSLDVNGPHDRLDARASVAYRTLGPELPALLSELESALGQLPFADETVARLSAAYRPGRPVAEAFAALLGGLFADDGLLLLDPRQPEIAALAAPIYARALAQVAPLGQALSARAQALTAAGFDVQVPVRADHSLLFFHEESERGPRFRVPSDACTGRLAACETTPLRFSTSALLRPLVQDRLLPTAAYVGGPGELSYFAELSPVYAAMQQKIPLVIPRARFRVVDPRARQRLQSLRLTAGQLECDEPTWRALLAEAALRQLTEAESRSPVQLRRRTAQLFEEILAEVSQAEPNLQRAVERTRATINGAVERLAARWERSLATRATVTTASLERLRNRLAPGGAPQERVLALPSLLARYGAAQLHTLVFDTLRPFSSALHEIG